MKQTSKYFALILLTVTFSFIGAAVYASNVFAKTEIDANGIPRCLSPYEEACGSNCKRNVTCGPNGEFRVSACNCQAQNQPTCPVATIWDGSVCKGTAKGTNDETKDTTPSSGGGEKVANKEKKPADPKTRQEANKVTVGGSSGGGGQQPGAATPTPTVTVNPICLRTREGCTSENGGTWCSNVKRCFPLGDNRVNCDTGESKEQINQAIDTACGVNKEDVSLRINQCRTQAEKLCREYLINRERVPERINIIYLENSKEFICKGASFQETLGTCEDTGTLKVNSNLKLEPEIKNPISNKILAPLTTETESDDTTSNSCNINCNSYCNVQGIRVTKRNEGNSVVCVFENDYTNTSTPVFFTCNQSGVTITDGMGRLMNRDEYCPTPQDIQGLLNQFQLVKPVKAQSLPEVIDPNDLEAGVYIIEIEGYKTATVQVFADNMTLEFFNDLNGDGIRQDNEPLLKPELTTIKIEKVSSITLIDFTEGWNLISLNTVSNTMTNASDLHTTINNQGIVVYQISKYDSGKWIHYVSRINEAGQRVEYGQDFPLIPGEGYFVRAINEGTVSLEGQKIDDNVAFTLENGWNLVGIQSKEKYTAYGVLNRCSAQSIQCSTISRYRNGAYQSVVFENNMTFGQDYDIESTSGYFIKNQGAKGEFKP